MEQITLRELLQDKRYREFFVKVPQHPMLDPNSTLSPAWRVWVRRSIEGSWGRRDFDGYPEAFGYLKRWLKIGAHDAALHSKRMGFPPPERLVRLKSSGATRFVPLRAPEGHVWCPYCRRFTMFKWFVRHHASSAAVRATNWQSEFRRCSICGVQELMADQRLAGR